jgi:hypothetical protein
MENGVSPTWPGADCRNVEIAEKATSRAVHGDAIAHRIDDAFSILFYRSELDGLGKRLRAFFAPAADGPFGRIFK